MIRWKGEEKKRQRDRLRAETEKKKIEKRLETINRTLQTGKMSNPTQDVSKFLKKQQRKGRKESLREKGYCKMIDAAGSL